MKPKFLKSTLKALKARIRIARLPQKPLSSQKVTVHECQPPAPGAETICFFSSFDIQSQVDDYVMYYLRGIRDQLKADIVFVTTSAELSTAEIDKLKPLCRSVIHRENIGHDFGSWKAGMELTPGWESRYTELVFANDSVYGPLSDLGRIVAPLRHTPPTIVGVTESLEHGRHLQSYFLAMNRSAFESRFFRNFWRDFRFFKDRDLTVEAYELGLSRSALNWGFELVPLVSYSELRDRFLREAPASHAATEASHRPVNPTHFFWKELVVHYQAPLLKTDLLKFNPSRVPDADSAIPVISRYTSYPVALIRAHLDRVAAQRTGIP